jgi:hypothetical protein
MGELVDERVREKGIHHVVDGDVPCLDRFELRAPGRRSLG